MVGITRIGHAPMGPTTIARLPARQGPLQPWRIVQTPTQPIPPTQLIHPTRSITHTSPHVPTPPTPLTLLPTAPPALLPPTPPRAPQPLAPLPCPPPTHPPPPSAYTLCPTNPSTTRSPPQPAREFSVQRSAEQAPSTRSFYRSWRKNAGSTASSQVARFSRQPRPT